MKWQVGQRLVCDRPEQLLTGCRVTEQQGDWVEISCPTIGLHLTGYQADFEQQGWQPETTHPFFYSTPSALSLY